PVLRLRSAAVVTKTFLQQHPVLTRTAAYIDGPALSPAREDIDRRTVIVGKSAGKSRSHGQPPRCIFSKVQYSSRHVKVLEELIRISLNLHPWLKNVFQKLLRGL